MIPEETPEEWDGGTNWNGEPLLRPSTVADLLGISTRALRNWADRGYLPVVKTPGGHRRFPVTAVLNYYRTKTSWGGER